MKRGMEFIRLLTEFFDSYLPDTKGVSENTIRSYKAALRIFFIFLEEEKGIPAGKVTFSVLDSSIVDEFLSWIQSTMIYATVTSDQANKILRERGLPAKLPAPEKEKGDEKTDVIWFLRE